VGNVILDGDVSERMLRTQARLLAQVVEIEGDLVIKNIKKKSLTAVVSLGALKKITGSITIKSNPGLMTLNGGKTLEIGKALKILKNEILRIVRMPNIKKIGNSLMISYNPILQSVTMPELITVDGNIIVFGIFTPNMPKLTELTQGSFQPCQKAWTIELCDSGGGDCTWKREKCSPKASTLSSNNLIDADGSEDGSEDGSSVTDLSVSVCISSGWVGHVLVVLAGLFFTR